MNCQSAQGKLADHVTGRLAPDEVGAVEGHLERCADCREFRRRIEGFYELEIPEAVSTPNPPGKSWSLPREELEARAIEGPRRVSRSLTRVAAVLLVLIVGGGLAWQFWSPARLPLPQLAITLPPLPAQYPARSWLDSTAEAELLARFSGKPLLEQIIDPMCARCQGVERELESPSSEWILDSFVCYRRALRAGPPPSWLGEYSLDKLAMMLPAMRITDGDRVTAPVLGIGSLKQIEALIATWRRRGEAETKKPLDRETFDTILAALDAIPELIDRAEYSTALSHLEEVISLGGEYRTAFVPIARRLRDQIDEDLALEVGKIEALAAGSWRERRQALDLASRFEPGLRGLPQGARLTALLAD